MQTLIEWVTFYSMMEDLSNNVPDDIGFMYELLVVIGITVNIAWFVFKVILPFALIAILIKKSRQKEG